MQNLILIDKDADEIRRGLRNTSYAVYYVAGTPDNRTRDRICDARNVSGRLQVKLLQYRNWVDVTPDGELSLG